MLVLTRKQGEVIQIGDGITVKVIKTGKGTVKIGIEAPGHVKVLRGELAAKMDAIAKTEGESQSSLEKAVLKQKSAVRPATAGFANLLTLPQTA